MNDSNESKPWFDKEDEEIFSKFEIVGEKFVPPQAKFLEYLECFVKDEKIPLHWRFRGRRAPTPENEETNEHEVDQYIEEERKSDKDMVEGFEFKDETNQFNLSSVRRTATPKGSAKKTKPNSLQSILSNIARHHKIDMLGTKDELKNKIKQQEYMQESNSNQPEPHNKTQVLNDENFNQSAGSQTQDSNVNLQHNEIESSSNSQLSETLTGQFINSENSLEHSQVNNETVDSTEFNQKSTSQYDNMPASDGNELNQVQQNVKQLQIFQDRLPQTNLNFQNLLKKSSKENASLNEVPTHGSDSQESVQNRSDVPEAKPPAQPAIQSEIKNQSSQIITSTSDTVVSSQSLQNPNFSKQMDFDTIGMNVKPMDYVKMKESEQSLGMLGSDLPLPEGSKRDLSEFDFQMED